MDEPQPVNPLGTPVVRRSRSWIGWVVLIIVLAVAGFTIYWYGFRPRPAATTANSATATPATTTSTPTTSQSVAAVTRVTDPGVTWLTTRTALADPGILVANGPLEEGQTPPSFSTVATTTDGGILVLASVFPNDPSPTVHILFKKTAAGTWLRYSRYSDSLDGYLYSTAKGLADTDADLPSLDVPNHLTLGSTNLLLESNVFMGLDLQDDQTAGTVKKLADTPYGDLVVLPESPNADPSPIRGQSMRIAKNDGRYSQMKVSVPFLRDDKTVNIKTTDGKALTGNYLDEGQGCGRTATTTIVADLTAIKDKVAVGTAPDGSTVYTLNGADNTILKTFYDPYKSTRDYTGSTEKFVTFDVYRQDTPLLLWQDGFGQWIILQSDKYASLAECGKPVVYLYPTKTTPVTVTVGAAITKSEPAYGSGWSGVATPNSQITVNGQTYPYLFWEGHGQGLYPDTSSIGVVVPQSAVRATLDHQLNELGLTAREQADFKEFWLPRLPHDPYVRLTWLTTAAMNQVAPLTVTPMPDTVIRVFLDFQGLSAPVTVRPQTLRAIPRIGFTVVEWGGLLH